MSRMRLRVWLFFMALAGCSVPGMPYDSAALRVLSPGGKFEVSFEPPNHEIPVDPDKEQPTAGLQFRHYIVSFYRPASRAKIASTDYYDFQSSSSQTFPTPVAELSRAILWNPQEDFVVLPKENWPPEKKKDVRRRAVSLNTDVAWQTAEFKLDDSPLAWTDRYAVAGTYREGCRIAVAEFDGRTGKLNTISEATLPAGYVLISSSEKSILMKKVLGPCAAAEDVKSFIPECAVFNLSFKRREVGPCPP
jgi:hypothetical protein